MKGPPTRATVGPQAEVELAATAAFVAIGHIPNTKQFEGGLSMDKAGYLNLDKVPAALPRAATA